MLSSSEAAIEAEIRTKGLNAPRLTPDKIDATIIGEDYHVFPGTTMTVCALKLRNGYVVIGEPRLANTSMGIMPTRRTQAMELTWTL